MATCGPGTAIDVALASADVAAKTYYMVAAKACEMLLIAYIVIWCLWQLIHLVSGKSPSGEALVRQFLIFVACLTMFATDQWWTEIFEALRDLSLGFTRLALVTTHADLSVNSIGDITCGTVFAMWETQKVAFYGVLKETGFTGVFFNFGRFILSVLLFVPIFGVLWKMFKNTVRPAFRFTVVALLAPFIILLAAFPIFARVPLMALKIVISAGLQLVTVGLLANAITTIFLMTTKSLPISATAIDLDGSQGLLGNDSYILLLVTMLVLWLFFDELISIVNSLIEVVENRMAEIKIPGIGGFRM